MRIVIKIGTSTLTDKSGKLNIPYIDSFAQEIAKLKKREKYRYYIGKFRCDRCRARLFKFNEKA